LTPLIYLAERRIEKYLGHNLAHKMKQAAMGKNEDPFINIPAAG
jgi:queuosine precursor transporter